MKTFASLKEGRGMFWVIFLVMDIQISLHREMCIKGDDCFLQQRNKNGNI